MNKHKERILLVENDPELSDLLSRQTLKPLGYQVEIVGAAPAAIQAAMRFAPDLILSSLSLTGLSCKDLLVALNSQGLDIPVIVIAPKGMESDVIQAFRLGAADLIYSPIREAEVASVIERVLRLVHARRDKELLANQLHQTNQELQQRVRELTTIFAIGKAVISTTDQRDLFNKILEGATFISESDSGWLLEREEQGKTFYLRACLNVPKEIAIRINQPWDDGLSSLVALSGECLALHGEPLKRFKVSQLGQSAIVVPVRAKKEVIGLLVVLRKTDRPFNNSQQALLEAVAGYASISLVNTHLFNALEERANAFKLVADNAIFDKQIDEEVMRKTAQELQDRLISSQSNLDKLLGRELGKINSHQEAALEAIRERVSSGLEILSLVQTMSQPPAKPKANRTDLNEAIRQMAQRMQPVAQRIGINLTLELPGKSIRVRADQSQISKVLEGLVSNAIKNCLQGGKVNIRVENPNETTARVEISDNGVGFDPKQLPFLIKTGLQEDKASSGQFSGVGISLPLINEIITNHGGKLWAESSPGKGSIFYFTLPMIPD